MVFAATVLLVAVHLFTSLRRFQQDTRQTADELIAHQKEMIRDEVNKVFEEIEYSRSRAETRLRDMVFQRVTEACQIAESLHKTHGTARPPAEVEALLCSALRPLRFNSGRSYYFIVRMNGQCLLLDPWKELEGQDLLKHPASASAVSNMIRIAREQGEGYTEYEWARPGEQSYGHRKIAYVKYFAPLNCFVGTGEYVSDWIADTQKALLERIRTISYRRNGYIFVGDWDGMMLAGRVLEGENVMDFRDPYGFEITRSLITTSRRGAGFVSYYFKKPETGELIGKLTFVRGLPEWRWYVGTGVYLDDVDAYLAEAASTPTGTDTGKPVLPHGKGERIIVVDDEPMIVELLSQRLGRLGYRVDVFTSSTEALTHILEHPRSLDLLITDQTMPHLTGFELGLKVKGILPELPIIICTGYSDWLTPAIILEKGFSAFFFKPVPTDQLATTLRTLLEKNPA